MHINSQKDTAGDISLVLESKLFSLRVRISLRSLHINSRFRTHKVYDTTFPIGVKMEYSSAMKCFKVRYSHNFCREILSYTSVKGACVLVEIRIQDIWNKKRDWRILPLDFRLVNKYSSSSSPSTFQRLVHDPIPAGLQPLRHLREGISLLPCGR
jgi:hypothetical protein